MAIFHEFLSEDQKKTTKNKNSLQSKKFYEIPCESAKITKIRAVNTNLRVSGLDFHSNNPEPVHFFGAQSSLGGHNFRLGGTSSHLGGMAPKCLPVVRACVIGACRVVDNCQKKRSTKKDTN